MILHHNEEERQIALKLGSEMVRRAIDLDGTCKHKSNCSVDRCTTHLMLGTGEHGVGQGKKKYMVEELGESTVEFMKHVKRSIDPLNLFNPGKVCLKLDFKYLQHNLLIPIVVS